MVQRNMNYLKFKTAILWRLPTICFLFHVMKFKKMIYWNKIRVMINR